MDSQSESNNIHASSDGFTDPSIAYVNLTESTTNYSDGRCVVVGDIKSKADNSSEESSNKSLIAPECPDSYVPYIGQCFNSIEDASNFYHHYARICGFSIRIGTKHFHNDGTLMTSRFSCHRQGYNNNLKVVDTLDGSQNDHRNRRVTRCGCEARFCVKFKSGGIFYVYDFQKNHNHSLASDIGKQFLKNSRGLTLTQQNLMIDCGKLGMGATRAHRFMAEISGGYANVGATVTDFKNFKRDLKTFIGGCDAQMVVDHFSKRKASCSEYTFEYFTDSDGTLLRMFWADPTSRRDSLIFGDVISFDATYCSNK